MIHPWKAQEPPVVASGASSGNSVSTAGSSASTGTRPKATRCFLIIGLLYQMLMNTSGADRPASSPSRGGGTSALVGFSFSPRVTNMSPAVSLTTFASYHMTVRTAVRP